MVTDTDITHLKRCIDLAKQALREGHQPFGSILVSSTGEVLFEDYNRVGGGDHTQHPEFAIARWAANNLPEGERSSCVVYTSGEPCPMCAAAHGWVGLGRIVYASSMTQLTAWLDELGVPPSAVRPLVVGDVINGVPVEGPVDDLANELRELHVQYYSTR